MDQAELAHSTCQRDVNPADTHEEDGFRPVGDS